MNTRDQFIDNTATFLSDSLSAYTVNIVRDDYNGDKETPCIIINVENFVETPNFLAHYNCDLNVKLLTNGADDSDHTDQRAIGDTLNDLLCPIDISELSGNGIIMHGAKYKGVDYGIEGDNDSVEYRSKIWLYDER